MMRSKVLCMAICLWMPAAFAHHSGALYDLTRTESVKGSVKMFIWSNPHAILMLTTEPKGKEPGTEWRFEMTSPGRLTRAGFTKRTLAPGDSITVDFNPMRDGSRVGWARKVTAADGKVLVFDVQGEEKPNLP